MQQRTRQHLTRVYVAGTLESLSTQWGTLSTGGTLHVLSAWAPACCEGSLRGEQLEEAEWYAMQAAAQISAVEALHRHVPRAVLACDIDDYEERETVTIDKKTGISVDSVSGCDVRFNTIASLHRDDVDLFSTPGEITLEALHERGLLWYDRTEIDAVLTAWTEHMALQS